MPDVDGEDFLPRALYGDYLQDVLMQSERAAPAHTRLRRIVDEVRHITPRGRDKPCSVEFTDRAPVMADRVILALGNPPPPLLPWAVAVRQHKAYLHDPWELPKTLATGHSVLIVGNGLTMADAALALTQDASRAPMVQTISRHGLVSLPQTTFRPSALRGDGQEILARADSIRRVLAMTREMTREVERRGGDWREVVTFIRHLAPALWRRLPRSEQRRCMRHLQAQWDVHRHRLPPQMGTRIAAARRPLGGDGRDRVARSRGKARGAPGLERRE